MNTSMDMEIEPVKCPEEFKENLTRYRAIVFYFEGTSISKIAQLLNKPKGTISKWVKKFLEIGDVIKEKEKTGRPKKITQDVEDQIKKYLKDNPSITQNEISEKISKEMGIQLTRQAIAYYLKSIGTYKLQHSIPILSKKNQEKRLEYAQVHKHDKFSNVIFSDESRFQLCSNTKKVFVLKESEIPQKPTPNPNFSVLVWGLYLKGVKLHWFLLIK